MVMQSSRWARRSTIEIKEPGTKRLASLTTILHLQKNSIAVPPTSVKLLTFGDFIEPTARCEGQSFITLNTYDRARFTFGFAQFAAHEPDGDFVTWFRDMLGQSEASDYFPDLAVKDGRQRDERACLKYLKSGGTVTLRRCTISAAFSRP